MIPYGKQNISQEDINAVVETLKSDFITQGPAIGNFESDLCKLTGAKHARALSSATAALHAVYHALGVGPGDLVWTVPNSFVATSNAALYCNAEVDFVDIDERTYNMCPQKLEEKLKLHAEMGRLPKLVVPVHFAGQSCDMAALHKLSKEYGFFLVEDASHAVGGIYGEQRVGSCEYSDAAVFSFHPVKIITTAEGGAVMTNSDEIAQKVELFRSHGITRDENLLRDPSVGGWYYEQIELGYNYRITDLQAALGSSQLKRIDSFIDRRHEKLALYQKKLANLDVILPYQAGGQRSALHLFPIQISQASGKSRKEVFEFLRNNGVGVNVHYIPIHTQPYYQEMGFSWGDFPVAENYYAHAISLPMFPDLSEDEIDYVCLKLTEALN